MFFLLLFLQRYLHPYTYLYCHSSSHVIPVVAFHIFSWSSRNLSEHRYDFCTQEFNDALELQLLLLHAKAPKPWWGSAARFTFAGVKHGRWQAQASQTLRTGKTSYTTTWRHSCTAMGVDSVDSVAIWANQPSLQPLSFAPIIATVCGPLFLLLIGSAAALVFTLEMCHILKPSKTEISDIDIDMNIYACLEKKDRIY